ncbi:MAG: hypothetical protein ACYCU0_00880 [Solirubrobacteraceae bacterium]
MAEDDRHMQEPTPGWQKTQPRGIDPKTGEPYEPIEIPVPKRGTWEKLLKQAAKPKH